MEKIVVNQTPLVFLELKIVWVSTWKVGQACLTERQVRHLESSTPKILPE